MSKREREGRGLRCWKIVERGHCNFTTDAPIEETLSVAGTFFVTGLVMCLVSV